MREIKFRAWDGKGYTSDFFITSEGTVFKPHYDREAEMVSGFIIEYFIGFNDKNGKEIYFGDLLRIKRTLYDRKYNSDGIYQVFQGNLFGVELHFVKLFGDGKENQYPIEQTLCERYKSLDIDYKNEKRDTLCATDTYGSNTMRGSTWKQADWSNDIEVIGNIHENQELING